MASIVQCEVASLTHTGLLRDHNEDSLSVDKDLGLFIVADGMGAHRAGDVASKLAVDAVRDRIRTMLPRTEEDKVSTTQAIRYAVDHANAMIHQAAVDRGENSGMGTTIALLLLRGRVGYVAHVGDSRVYRLRQGRLEAMTRDHSLLQAQVGAGLISGEEARHSHNRNLVTRALGVEAKTECDVTALELDAGDTFLLCSDGLNTMVDDEDIALTLGELEPNLPLAVQCLVEIANDNGGHDNITVVGVRIRAQETGLAARTGLFARLLAWLFGKRD